jgi:hypothetical protein
VAESEAEICNLALSHIGVAKEIGNLETDAGAEASACRRFYAITRNQVLRDFAWPFTTKYAALGLVAENPSEIDQEWRFVYRYPSDCIKIRRIVSGIRPEPRQARIPFQIARDSVGQIIYTNRENAEAEYTILESDVSRYPDDFVQALSLRLAAYISPRLTGGDPFKVGTRALQLYQFEIARAQATAGNEEQPHEDPNSELERSRGGGVYEVRDEWWR